MTESGENNVADNKVAEVDDDNKADDTAITESGEISIGTNSNDIFSDAVPGEESSAATDSPGGDDDCGDDDSDGSDKE